MHYIDHIGLASLTIALLALVGCSPQTKTLVAGDRDIEQVSAGKLSAGDGEARYWYIIRDKHTKAEYLAVIDAGIIKLEPKPLPQVEGK
jgi:hypothetical protein